VLVYFGGTKGDDMNVLLVNGSPHADGCTSTALGEVAKVMTNFIRA